LFTSSVPAETIIPVFVVPGTTVVGFVWRTSDAVNPEMVAPGQEATMEFRKLTVAVEFVASIVSTPT
jgi:hypothetical protein